MGGALRRSAHFAVPEMLQRWRSQELKLFYASRAVHTLSVYLTHIYNTKLACEISSDILNASVVGVKRHLL